MAKTQVQTRGQRNHNPLNIRIGNTWLGESPHPKDNEFEEFVSDAYGLRAAFVILRRYIRRYHLNTVTLIVSRWAPSNENNTTKYIDFVAHRMNVQPDMTIDYNDIPMMVSLVAAMAKYESGMELSEELLNKAYNMA